ncbi:MAG: hypothetical protein PWP38_2755 [Clostridiales bacterium]|nr:hypothetical protein [Clostridiales bacterium]
MRINHGSDMSHILNLSETQFKTSGFAGLMITPDSLLNQGMANANFDLLDISKEGMEKIEKLKSGDIHEIEMESLEELLTKDKRAYLEEAMFGSALAYKKEHDWILNNTQDEDQKNKLLEDLNQVYISRVGGAIQEIGMQLDNFFDKGRTQLQRFSKEAVGDIFDVDIFKSQLAEKALTAKDYVMTSETTVGIDAVKQYVRDNEKQTNAVERMTYDELEAVIGFMDSYHDIVSQVESDESIGGRYYAQVDDAVNTAISELNVDNHVKDALTENQQRYSEALMRRDAFSETMDLYDSTLEAYKEQLNKLMSRLAIIQSRLAIIEEEGGIDPSNKRLLGLLEFQSALSDEIKLLKDETKNVENEKRDLSKHPENAVETDSYKRIKADYEHEREKLADQK